MSSFNNKYKKPFPEVNYYLLTTSFLHILLTMPQQSTDTMQQLFLNITERIVKLFKQHHGQSVHLFFSYLNIL